MHLHIIKKNSRGSLLAFCSRAVVGCSHRLFKCTRIRQHFIPSLSLSGRVGTDARIIRLNGYPCAVCEGRQLHITSLPGERYVTFHVGQPALKILLCKRTRTNEVSVYSHERRPNGEKSKYIGSRRFPVSEWKTPFTSDDCFVKW